MGLSTALFNGISALSSLSQSLNVIGNNLANINTIGFKASTALFETVFSQTLTGATGPSGNLLGTNPLQIGLGVTLSTINRNFSQGSLNATGNLSDMAIQGNGFFILSDGTSMSFTRDGSFGVAVDGTLIDPATGLRVQGYQAVDGVVVPSSAVGDIQIPLGESIVQETSNAIFSGNFDASGDFATTGTVTDGPSMLDTATALPATDTTLLTNLQDASGTSLGLADGDVITITARSGGSDITVTYTVTAASTLDDLASAIESGFGIVDGSVTIDTDGSILITGDPGEGNAITDIIMTAVDSTGTARTDFNNIYNPGGASGFTELVAADGESFVLSGLNVFDSLGNAVPLTLTFTYTGPNTLRYVAESPFGTVVGSGTITYDANGQFVSVDNDLIAIDRSGVGAITPLDITLDFSNTTLLSGENTIAMSSQDGFPIGSIEGFTVGNDGVITGVFSNGMTRTLGQVAIATFANQGGLLAIGENQFIMSANSGEAMIGAPGTGGRGIVVGGYLEGSNVDIATEFTNIILTQRGFQANSRTITAADTLLEEVISLVR
ncbi:MAG: hypothetical protein Kow0099_05630 [Candidatus Abyssubacteria bacterium]